MTQRRRLMEFVLQPVSQLEAEPSLQCCPGLMRYNRTLQWPLIRSKPWDSVSVKTALGCSLTAIFFFSMKRREFLKIKPASPGGHGQGSRRSASVIIGSVLLECWRIFLSCLGFFFFFNMRGRMMSSRSEQLLGGSDRLFQS